MDYKPWYMSKTFWAGILTMASAGITASMEIGATWQTITLAVVGAAMVGLRATRLTR